MERGREGGGCIPLDGRSVCGGVSVGVCLWGKVVKVSDKKLGSDSKRERNDVSGSDPNHRTKNVPVVKKQHSQIIYI